MYIEPLTEVIAARVTGVTLSGDMNDADFESVRAAFEMHSVLVFPDQPMDDEAQCAFSARFGPLEHTIDANPARGTAFARQSNLDIDSGRIIASGDRRMRYQRGNYQWHADSTFKPIPSLCSILTAREVPPAGGDTEFASTRAAFESLSPRRQAALAGLTVVHDIVASRRRSGFDFSTREAGVLPPARHPLVQTNPATGRRSVLVGAHAASIDGWAPACGRALLDALLALATVPAHRYRHRWTQHDLVIWDNRSSLHRATDYDAVRYRRLMQRTTVSWPQAS